MQRSLGNFHLPYITISPTFSICPQHGYLDGEHEFCPRCDEELITRLQSEQAGDHIKTEENTDATQQIH